MESTLHSCQILMTLQPSQQIFEKYLCMKLYEKSVLWEPSCSVRGDTKKHGHRRLSQFCKDAQNKELDFSIVFAELLCCLQ